MSDIARQDEILQMMYWMRGEHLGDDVSAEQLNRFLGTDEETLGSTLAHLVSLGLLDVSRGSYTLTERGVAEGARRFADEFSSVLGKEDHLSCSDPDCDCQKAGWEGVCRSVELDV